jgi:hypothetical protein
MSRHTVSVTAITLAISAIAFAFVGPPSFTDPRALDGISTPTAVTITLVAHKAENPPVFTWSSSGGISDAGDWVDGKFFWAAVRSPVVGTLHNELNLVGSKGTIKLRLDGLLTPTEIPDVLFLAGNWRVLSGTGEYANLRGEGTASVTFHFADSSAFGTFSGSVQ